jgi:hypothetical protein
VVEELGEHRVLPGLFFLLQDGEELLHVEEAAVAVEVDDLVGLARGVGATQRLPQLLEGRRAEHIEVEGFPRLLREALQESGGDRAEGDVLAAVRPADDEQDAQRRPGPQLGQRGGRGRVGLRAHEGAGAQGERNLGLLVAQQLPGDGRRLAHPGHDLHPGLREPRPQRRPEVAGVVALEDRLKELDAERRHPLLDPRGDLRCRVLRELQVVLQIPAEVLLVAVRKAEGELDRGGLPREAVDLKGDLDVVHVLAGAGLRQAESRHADHRDTVPGGKCTLGTACAPHPPPAVLLSAAKDLVAGRLHPPRSFAALRMTVGGCAAIGGRSPGASGDTEAASALVSAVTGVAGAATAPVQPVIGVPGAATAPASSVIAVTGAATAPASSVIAVPGAVTAPASAVIAVPGAVTAPASAVIAVPGAAAAPASAVIAVTGAAAAPASAVIAVAGAAAAPASSVIAVAGAATAPGNSAAVCMPVVIAARLALPAGRITRAACMPPAIADRRPIGAGGSALLAGLPIYL